MAGDGTVAAGWTALVTGPAGWCAGGDHGFFHRGTRVLDRYELAVGDRAVEPIGTLAPRPGERVLAATVRGDPPATLRRTRMLVGGGTGVMAPGVYERVELRNGGDETLPTTLRLGAGTRFDGVAEVAGTVEPRSRSVGIAPGDGVTFTYDPDEADVHHRAGVAVGGTAKVDVHGGPGRADAVLGTDVRVPPGGARTLHVASVAGDPVAEPAVAFVRAHDRVRERVRTWRNGTAPPPVADDRAAVLRRAADDLLGLSVDTRAGTVPVAGLPWAGTVDARAALVAGTLALPLTAEPARGTLRYLADGQAGPDQPDATPGAIVTALRQGERAVRDHGAVGPGYGGVAATPLFVVLLHATWRRTGDDALVDELWPAVAGATDWLTEAAEGFLRGPAGWAGPCVDDVVVHPDARAAAGPPALAAAQGYAHDALARAAALAREVRGAPDRATGLERQARVLRRAFDDAYWLPGEGTYAVALEPDGTPVRSVTAAPAHCLWSGVVPEDRADAVVDRLLADDAVGDWGLRSLSPAHGAYDQERAHRGAVAPGDTAIAALGAARYGRREAAERFASVLLDAATARGRSLPAWVAADGETPRVVGDACDPAAVAAVAPLGGLRATGAFGRPFDG